MSNPPSPPKTRRPQSVQDLLRRSAAGQARTAIAQGVGPGEALRQRVVDELPAEWAAQVSAAIAKPADGGLPAEVVVFVATAAWAARLKLHWAAQPPDLQSLVPAGALIKVKVLPGGKPRR